MTVAYIDGHRHEFGVEPISQVLAVPSTYYSLKARQVAPSARAVRDTVMMQVLMTLWVANRKVCGAHKLWKAAGRAGHSIGRDQVARLMRELAIEGVSRRRKKVITTRADPAAVRAPDLVKRKFSAERPDALWVTDPVHPPPPATQLLRRPQPHRLRNRASGLTPQRTCPPDRGTSRSPSSRSRAVG